MEDSHHGLVHIPNYKCYNNNVANISEVEDICSNVVRSIEEMMEQLPHFGEECNIYRVLKNLRKMNETVYGPQFISIGPFHHRSGKDLIVTEQYKLQGLKNYLRRIENVKLLEDLVKTAEAWVKEIRSCYAEPKNMKDEEFVKMVLVDGCFIAEYFILDFDPFNRKFSQIQKNVNLSVLYQGMHSDIYSDLTKLENQVPFFVPERLFDLIPQAGTPIFFIELPQHLFSCGWVKKYELCDVLWLKPKHLVDFLGFYYIPMSDVLGEKENNIENKNDFISFFRFLLPASFQNKHNKNMISENKKFMFSPCLSFLRCHRQNKHAQEMNSDLIKIPPSITELCEAGVTIKKAEQTKCMMDTSFKNGVSEIPPLLIDDHFETIMRNLIAFEEFPAGNKQNAIYYVRFLDELISIEKDVSVLVKAGIIINNY